jgi:hypothetical protein
MSSTDVLVNIFSTLQRLETSLDDQHHRLHTIEVSIRSSTTSPTPDGFSPLARSPMTDKQLPDLPGRFTSPPSSYAEYAASVHDATVLKLYKRRFEFKSDSCSDLQDDEGTAGASESNDGTGGAVQFSQSPAERLDVPEPSNYYAPFHNNDAYSQSAYSSRPLSRLDMDIPPVPPLPKSTDQAATPRSDFGAPTISMATPEGGNSGSVAHDEAVSVPSSPVTSFLRRKSWSTRRTRSRSSLSSSVDSSRRSHEQVEMAFYAYDNLKGSLRSSISLNSKERHASRAEARRLASLCSASKRSTDLCPVLYDEKSVSGENGLRNLFNFFIRVFGKAGSKYHAGRISVVA